MTSKRRGKLASFKKVKVEQELRGKTEMKFKVTCGLILLLSLAAVSGWADTLELRNGSIINGRFIAGNETEITFQVGSSQQNYNVDDIVSLKFDSERSKHEVPGPPSLPREIR
jgi:hypothetical protein